MREWNIALIKKQRTLVALLATAFALLLSLIAGSSAAAQTPADRDMRDPSSELTAAYPFARNGENLDLKFPTDAGDEACVSRDIKLAAGVYEWFQFYSSSYAGIGGDVSAPRHIELAAGEYHWKDCVGALSQGGYTYYHDTYLRRNSTGSYAHLPRTTFNSDSRGTFSVTYSSHLTWIKPCDGICG